MNFFEKLTAARIDDAAYFLRLARQQPNAATAALYSSAAYRYMQSALTYCNSLPPQLKAKHRGPIMSRLNKVRALARRAAA